MRGVNIRSEVCVVGGGVLGLATASELTARGYSVVVVDPGGGNASGVAAGMLAPAMESLLDPVTRPHARLLKHARDLWPAFAMRHGLALERDGAEWVGADAAERAAELADMGFEVELGEGRLWTPEDWRIDAPAALERLRRDLNLVTAQVASLRAVADGWDLTLSDGRTSTARKLVLATGAAPAIAGAPEAASRLIDAIQPIRGQIARVAGVTLGVTSGVASGVRRARGVYLAPSDGGLRMGATMETGRRDLTPDPEVMAGLGEAARLAFGAAPEVLEIRVGVRGATDDGLPLAGATEAADLFLALAPRRNGWLLAPLVARTVADAVDDLSPSPWAAALSPDRF